MGVSVHKHLLEHVFLPSMATSAFMKAELGDFNSV
jgi:hypothetical protein